MDSKKTTMEHPPYLQMIKEAISSLKERTGSSQPAIAKFLEDKYKKQLPPNFRILLSVQLRRYSKSEKLFKIKKSYKITTPAVSAPTTAAAATKKKKKVPAASTNAKAAAPSKKVAIEGGKKAAKKPVKTKVAKKPVLPAGEKKKEVKKTPVKTKLLKDIKSPKAAKPVTKKRVAAKSIKAPFGKAARMAAALSRGICSRRNLPRLVAALSRSKSALF